MRSNNLQLPCVQPPTSSNNLQIPHGRHGHGGHGDHGGLGGHFGHGGRGEHGGHGGLYKTGQTKLTFKLDFPGSL